MRSEGDTGDERSSESGSELAAEPEMGSGNGSGSGSGSERNGTPWIHPKIFFALLCILELLVYMDRGAFASNGINEAMVEELNLSNSEDGALQTSFIAGLLIASPCFAQAASSSSVGNGNNGGNALGPFRLIGIGQLVWAASMVLSSIARDAWSMAASRALVGVGEASFCSIAPVFIDDYAPEKQRGLWLAIYYTFLPFGFAVGYGYGGLISSLNLTWRVAFLIEAFIMSPFVLFFLLAPQIRLKSRVDEKNDVEDQDTVQPEQAIEDSDVRHSSSLSRSSSLTSSPSPSLSPWSENKSATGMESVWMRTVSVMVHAFTNVVHSCKTCFSRSQYSLVVLASITYTFVIGALAFWGPKAGKETFNLHGTTTDSLFALMAACAGVFGTLSSGAIIYKIQSRQNAVSETFLFIAISMLSGMIFLLIAMTVPQFDAFLVMMGISMFSLFLTQAPTYALSMQLVPSSMRSMACALCTVAVHVFGDGPSPYLVGVLQDRVKSWRVSLSISSLVLIPGVLALLLASFKSFSKNRLPPNKEDKYLENNEIRPLLVNEAASDKLA